MNGRRKKRRTGKILLWCARWQQEHWVLSLILVRISAIWFSLIVNYGGSFLKLTKIEDDQNQLTLLGWFLTILLVGWISLNEVANEYKWNKTQDKYDIAAAFVLRNLRDATASLCDSKYNTLLNEIDKIRQNSNCPIPQIISDPEKQLDGLSNQLSNCLCQLLQEDKGERWRINDVCVSIAYEFPSEKPNVWHWATKERGLSLDKLFNETDGKPISTMLHCLKSKGNKVFFNSKQKAFEDKHYLPDQFDEYDSDGNLLGSIACFEDTIKKNDIVYIHYILSISTYDKKFVSINIDNIENQEEANEVYKKAEDAVKYNIHKIIVTDFLMRAKVEFCLLYLLMLEKNEI